MTSDFDLKGKASGFINDIKTIQWLRKQHYGLVTSRLHENEIKMMAELEEKYAPFDVVQMLLDEHDKLRADLEVAKEALQFYVNLNNPGIVARQALAKIGSNE